MAVLISYNIKIRTGAGEDFPTRACLSLNSNRTPPSICRSLIPTRAVISVPEVHRALHLAAGKSTEPQRGCFPTITALVPCEGLLALM